MKAIIFSAGLGTRLKPLTDNIPKALVEVGGKTLLEHAIFHLKFYNVTDIVVNVHHFAEKVKEQAKVLGKKYDINIEISDESERLLETGGGLKKAKNYFINEDDFIAYNVDIISNLNIRSLIEFHKKQQPLVSLVVRGRKTTRYFLFNEKMELCGWKNMQTNEIIIRCKNVRKFYTLAFSGIQIINTKLLSLLDKWEDVFSITDVYIKLCEYYKIYGFIDNSSIWMDVGTIEKLNLANQLIKNLKYEN